MILKKYSEIPKDNVDKFVMNSNDFNFLYTTTWINLITNLREQTVENLSFAVYLDSELVAYVPLLESYMSSYTMKNEFSMFAFPLPYPMFSKKISQKVKDRVEKLIFEEIFRLAKQENVEYMNFYVPPLTEQVLSSETKVNPLLKFGFHDTTISTNILTLKEDENTIYRNFRKGTKSDIKTAIRNGFKVEIFDHNNIKDNLFLSYKNIHFKASARKTRPDKTWEIMLEWIKNDLSVLALTYKDNSIVSAQLINTFHQKAYYQSGATLPEFQRERGMGHLAQWEIIRFLKSKNFTHYEIGWNWYLGISQEVADAKMLGISRFKAGFGAKIYPLFRGEWFANEDIMREIYNERIEKYWKFKKEMLDAQF